MCATMAQESFSSASTPGGHDEDDARAIRGELSPAMTAFAGRARVADQCVAAETVILHKPVDAVVTYAWDARRGRNLHVAWPANIPELARYEPETNADAKTPFDRTRTPRDSILVVKKGASVHGAGAKNNRAGAETGVVDCTKIDVPSLKTPRFPTAQAREASARWPQLLLRGQTHRRLNAYGPGVAPPGTRLTGAPDWKRDDDDDDDDNDDDETSSVSTPRETIRVTHVARRDGEIVARQRRVVSSSTSSSVSKSELAETLNRTVGCALRARATRGSMDGRLPGATWRAAHRDARVRVGDGGGVASLSRAERSRTFGYGVKADLALGYGSASQPHSRSKLHAPGDPARRSTTRTFRDEPEVARAVARTRGDDAFDAATLVAAAKAIRGRATVSLDSKSYASAEDTGSSPTGSGSRGRLQARRGLGGGNLPADPSAASRRAEPRPREARSEPERTRRGDAGDPTSPASHIARLGALSASFNDRQRAMVGRGVQEARTRIRDERSWGK
jgi:hypothetical protein